MPPLVAPRRNIRSLMLLMLESLSNLDEQSFSLLSLRGAVFHGEHQ